MVMKLPFAFSKKDARQLYSHLLHFQADWPKSKFIDPPMAADAKKIQVFKPRKPDELLDWSRKVSDRLKPLRPAHTQAQEHAAKEAWGSVTGADNLAYPDPRAHLPFSKWREEWKKTGPTNEASYQLRYNYSM